MNILQTIMSNTEQKKIKIYIIPILIIALLTALDQLTKTIIVGKFAVQESIDVIKGVFTITYVQNRGIAWGMLEGKIILFLIMTFLIVGLCFYVYQNILNYPKFRLFRICLIVLISGAIGNMIDRVKLGYVIDFFSFDLIDFPVFNVADIYIVCSMFVIFFLILFKFKDDDLTKLFKKIPDDSEDKHGLIRNNTTKRYDIHSVLIYKRFDLCAF